MPTDKIARLRHGEGRHRVPPLQLPSPKALKKAFLQTPQELGKAATKTATPFTNSTWTYTPAPVAMRNQVPATVALRSSIQWRKAVKGSMPTAKHYTIFIAKVNAANEVTEVDCAFYTYYKHSPNGTQHFPYWMPASEGLKLFPKP